MSVSVGERLRAELALEGRASAQLSDLQAQVWPSVADRIREARLRTGLSDTAVARRLGITIHSYGDLESYDSEAFTVVSLKDLAELGNILGVLPRVIILGGAEEGRQQTVSFDDVTALIVKKMSETGLTADQFGELAGWDITMEHYNVLDNPQLFWEYSVEALYDICKLADCDWVAALPDLPVASHAAE